MVSENRRIVGNEKLPFYRWPGVVMGSLTEMDGHRHMDFLA